tara:strand:+ start:3825 stop:4853 length:1029 start_codon:yes stop_codon:yes gene_type:complete
MRNKILVTGGAGFIGHQAIKKILEKTDWEILTFDRLSYAGDLKRLDEVSNEIGKSSSSRLKFLFHDLKAPFTDDLISEINEVSHIVHIGASSHVTKSVQDPYLFIQDNIVGTFNLLEAARKLEKLEMFYYFSTDEVFGPSDKEEKFLEWDRYNSKNPYSATKAGGEELTIAYSNTYSIPSLITHCSNVYGKRQHYEKYIPNTIKKILNNEEIIIHTDKNNKPGSRYYLYNEDLSESILFLISNFKKVQKVAFDVQQKNPTKINISGNSLISNLEVAELISNQLNKDFNYKFLANDPIRPGHDIKYGLDSSLLESLGGSFDRNFDEGLKETIDFYQNNNHWLN